MKKKIIISSIIALILAIITVLIYRNFIQKTEYRSEVYAIPENAVILFNSTNITDDFNKLFETSFWNSLKSHQKLSHLDTIINFWDSIIIKNENFKDFLIKNPLTLSLHVTAMHKTDILLSVQTFGKLKPTDVENIFSNAGFDLYVKERTFTNRDIYELFRKDHSHFISYSIIDGIFLLSLNPVLIEDAIRTYDILKAAEFHKKLADNRNKNHFSINYRVLGSFLGTLLSRDQNEILPYFNELASFSILEKNIQDNHFAFHGTTFSSDTLASSLEEFAYQRPVEINIAEKLPDRTAFFLAYGIDDTEKWLEAKKQSLNKSNRYTTHIQQSNDFKSKYNIELNEELRIWQPKEIVVSVYEPPTSDFSNHIFGMVKSSDPDALLLHLHKKVFSTETDTIFYREHIIAKFPYENFFPLAFGKAFNAIKQPYFVNTDEYILFSDNIETLRRVLDAIDANRVLARSSRYIRFTEQLATESNVFMFINTRRSAMIPLDLLRDELKSEYNDNRHIFTQLEMFAVQFSSIDQNFFTQIVGRFAPEERQLTERLWALPLDTNIHGKPYVFRSHVDKRNEVFFQDKKNRIHLVENSGKVLWDLRLPSLISGEVSRIDLYKNNRYQFLFTGKNYLQLIDRNGVHVANFPIGLSAAATTGLSVFDIRNNKDYTLYLGTENNAVYGFNANARPLTGWSPKQIESSLVLDIKYFIFKGNTYLFSLSENGYFYLWDLRGRNIIPPVNLETRFKNPFHIKFGSDNSDTWLFSSDTSGTLYLIDLNGNVSTKKYGNWGPDHGFDYTDITGNGNRELVFWENRTLKAFRDDSTLVINITLPEAPTENLQFLEFQDKPIIGLVNSTTERIYLLYNDGNVLQGFPLEGNTQMTMADMNDDGNLELIVGGKNQLLIYRIR